MSDTFFPQWAPSGLNGELSAKVGDTVEVGDLCWWDSANSAVRPASTFANTGDGATQLAFAALFVGVANFKQRSSDLVAARAKLVTDVVIEFACSSNTFAVGDYVEPDYVSSLLVDQVLEKTTNNLHGIGRVVGLYASAVTKVKVRMWSKLLSGSLAPASVASTGDITVDSVTGGDASLGITGAAGSSGAGGIVAVLGGAGDSGAGGAVSLIGGTGSSGAGGAATLQGGAGNGTGGGGAVAVTGGAAGATNVAGGAVALLAGVGGGTGAGGAITLTSGASGGGATGNGGAITGVAGAAVSTNGTGGAVSFTGGTGKGSGAGGAASLVSGAGLAAGTGAGGAVAITAGVSGTGATGNGGTVTVTAGASSATDGNGGNIALVPGALAGTGVAGSVRVAGALFTKQGAPTAKTTAVTLTNAELLTRIITGTHSAGATAAYTLPIGSDMSLMGTLTDADALDWHLINLSAAAVDTITLTANTAHTIVGNPIVQSAHVSTGGVYGNSAHFRSRKSSGDTWITYRLA